MYYIGIDLGGTKIAAGLVTKDGNIIYRDSVPTLRLRSYTEIVKDMAELVLKVIKHSGASLNQVEYIGIGSPGTVNSRDGTALYCNSLNFRNIPLKDELQKYIKLPVYVDNDANCAALAEGCFGSAKGLANSITITLGTGIGGGMIINGRIYRGFNNAAGEVGHMVIAFDGEQCTCGRRGCWEKYASGTALMNQARLAASGNPNSVMNKLSQGDISKITGKIAFDAVKLKDDTAEKVVEQYIRYVSAGIINIINIAMPDMVVIGGGVSLQGESLLQPLKHMVYPYVYASGHIPKTRLSIARFGNDAGIIGAAMLGNES